MPTLYGVLGSPFVRKVVVALTEKGIKYDHDQQIIPFATSPEYRKISPLGKIPAYRDGDRTLPDSSVILAYLERTHPEPPLYPSDPYDYARALWYEEYGDDGISPITGTKIFFARVIAPRFMNQPPDEAASRRRSTRKCRRSSTTWRMKSATSSFSPPIASPSPTSASRPTS